MRFQDEKLDFNIELEAYFGAPVLDIGGWERELLAVREQHPEWSPYRCKIAGYELISARCPVKIFRHLPFFFEINTGRPRTDLGSAGLGTWFKHTPAGRAIADSGDAWWQTCNQTGLSLGWHVLDDNHHTVGYEHVLQFGLAGLIRQAEARRATTTTDRQRDFLDAAIAGNRALIHIAGRMADEATRLANGETDPFVRQRLTRIAAAARRVPAEPATTFYEALCAIIFMFYGIPAIEGNGVSVFGHVDRLLGPYYVRDLAERRITPEEAHDLIGAFLAISDQRFGKRQAEGWHVGTNGTVTVGGCDATGQPVFNDMTRMLVANHRDLRLIDPKLNARISARHPREYFDLLAGYIAAGGNALAIFNDDVVIEANVKAGKAREDCRLYVGGGCQENVLETCEVNSRASIYLNLAQVFLAGFFPERIAEFSARNGFTAARFEDCRSFEDLYTTFLQNLKGINDKHIDQRNRTEGAWLNFNPCPLHSTTLADCIAKAQDMMEGGCRYSQGSVALTGIGTLIDSLYAVKDAVYDRKLVSLVRLRQMLADNFAGDESFRALLANRIPKFGYGDEAIRAFSARVFADVARVTSGRSNTRGGRYEASLFSFRTFSELKARTGATPDGRKAGELLSPGMGPSLIALGKESSIGQMLAALEPLDLTLYPVVAVLDIKLPAARSGISPAVIVPVIRRFLDAGGSVLQPNCVDQAELVAAREHPEQHPDLVVRVSGYSAYFTTLMPDIQDEIVERTVAQGG